MPFLVGIGSGTYFLVKMKILLFSKFQNFKISHTVRYKPTPLRGGGGVREKVYSPFLAQNIQTYMFLHFVQGTVEIEKRAKALY